MWCLHNLSVINNNDGFKVNCSQNRAAGIILSISISSLTVSWIWGLGSWALLAHMELGLVTERWWTKAKAQKRGKKIADAIRFNSLRSQPSYFVAVKTTITGKSCPTERTQIPMIPGGQQFVHLFYTLVSYSVAVPAAAHGWCSYSGCPPCINQRTYGCRWLNLMLHWRYPASPSSCTSQQEVE